MSDITSNPVINPLLSLISMPERVGISGGGKDEKDIKRNRLTSQRNELTQNLEQIKSSSNNRSVDGIVTIVITMFEDSYRPTLVPKDLLRNQRGANLIAPFKGGYLAELYISAIDNLISTIQNENRSVPVLVDITRVKKIELLNEKHVLGRKIPSEIFNQSINVPNEDREFLIWFVPHINVSTRAKSLQQMGELLNLNQISLAHMVEGRETSNVVTTIGEESAYLISHTSEYSNPMARLVPFLYKVGLRQSEQISVLAGSGKVIRIEPISSLIISESDFSEGADSSGPTLVSQPVVAVVDGGRTARSYELTEAWKQAPELVHTSVADTKHGNEVTSLVVHGHQLNNHLELPELYCRSGNVQVLHNQNYPGRSPRPEAIIKHLENAIINNPTTKVWNFSLNARIECDEVP